MKQIQARAGWAFYAVDGQTWPVTYELPKDERERTKSQKAAFRRLERLALVQGSPLKVSDTRTIGSGGS